MNTRLKEHINHLLENYRKYTQQIALLRYELAHHNRISADEMLEAMALSKVTGDAPTKGHISDKTYYIALNYLDRAADLNAERLSNITDQLRLLETRIDRLTHCVNQLRPDYEQVISGLYFSGKNLRVVATEMHISERTVQRYRDAAIGELVEMYEVLSEAGLSPE